MVIPHFWDAASRVWVLLAVAVFRVGAKEGKDPNVELISECWKRLFDTHLRTIKLVSIRILERCGWRGVVEFSEPTEEWWVWV